MYNSNFILVKKDGIKKIIDTIGSNTIENFKFDIEKNKWVLDLITNIQERGLKKVDGEDMVQITKQEMEKLKYYYELPF